MRKLAAMLTLSCLPFVAAAQSLVPAAPAGKADPKAAFERLKVVGSWAGYYEFNVFDHNGIVGTHPSLDNAIVANGFSGHGIQQSPAVGRAVAELILDGGFRAIDLTPLSFDRILRGEKLLELAII